MEAAAGAVAGVVAGVAVGACVLTSPSEIGSAGFLICELPTGSYGLWKLVLHLGKS